MRAAQRLGAALIGAGCSLAELPLPARTVTADVPDEGGCEAGSTSCEGECFDFATSTAHCGRCQHACNFQHSTGACVAGSCSIASCAEGYGDCDGLADNGCEEALGTAVNHCGMCGHRCAAAANASASCGAGRCGITCTAGFGDCDGDLSNGCETVTSVGDNCGSCGHVCGSGERCTAGVCCATSLSICGGRCSDLTTDASNCGSCGHACGAGGRCMAGLCCAAGLSNCSNRCVNLMTDGSNCRSCGLACASGMMCQTGMCTLPAPRPIAPLSTATVSSRRPTLRWQLAPGTDGAHVEICRDRACTMQEQSADAAGSMFRPASWLPAGVHFWRLFGRASSAVGVVPSPTWQFVVGSRSTEIDTSWGTTADFNGDGYSDVVVGATETAYIYPGGMTGVTTTPTVRGGLAVASYGRLVASAGDVNGDGFADLAVARGGNVYIYLGSPNALAEAPVALDRPADIRSFGYSIAGAGDVNRDGYADLVVGSELRTYIYLGSPAGLASSPTILRWMGSSTDGVGAAGAGDFNGDGFADVIVGSRYATYLHLGSTTGPSTTGAYMGNLGDAIAVTVAGAGDVNGDGYADIVVGAPGSALLYYLGNASGSVFDPRGLPRPSSTFGAAVAGAGDINGDGYADVIIGDGCEEGSSGCGPGGAYVYLGGTTGLATPPIALSAGPTRGMFGRSVAGAGDTNGDGYADLVIGASGANAAYVFLGTATGLNIIPTSLAGPEGLFGISVASSDRRRRGPPRGAHRNQGRVTEAVYAPAAVAQPST